MSILRAYGRPGLIASLLCSVTLSSALSAEGLQSPTAEQLEAYWGSGAEITKFDLEQARYGETHAGHAELIFAREPFLVSQQVKHEFGSGESTSVLKLNALRTFNTGLYSYRTMQSTFLPMQGAGYPHALKTNLSVQDWCGQAFQQVNRREGALKVETFSYFQSPGDDEVELGDVWLEDELIALLRRDPGELPVGEIEVVPALLFGRLGHVDPKAERAVGRLEVEGEVARYELRYPQLGRTLTIEFGAEFPFYVQGWTEVDKLGTTTARRTHGMGQVEYWRLNKTSDGALRERLGLEEVAD